jgi:hypothetical protein
MQRDLYQPPCPSCRRLLTLTQVHSYESFRCPHCREKLRIHGAYAWSLSLGAILLAVLVPPALHLTWFWYFFVVPIVWFLSLQIGFVILWEVIRPEVFVDTDRGLSLFDR